MIYLDLFLSFLFIGVTGFGGGYAMLSLIQHEVVTKHGWITSHEFADIIAISQMTPGPISINSATYIGYTTTGSVWGSVVTTLGVCLPSLILTFIGSYFFVKLKDNLFLKNITRALRPVVIGLILSASFVMITKENFIDYRSYLIFIVAFIGVWFKQNPIVIIAISGVLGYFLF